MIARGPRALAPNQPQRISARKPPMRRAAATRRYPRSSAATAAPHIAFSVFNSRQTRSAALTRPRPHVASARSPPMNLLSRLALVTLLVCASFGALYWIVLEQGRDEIHGLMGDLATERATRLGPPLASKARDSKRSCPATRGGTTW